MSQAKSEGMSLTELVESWCNGVKFLTEMSKVNERCDGVKATLEACADGLELEIKRSNYVSGKEISESDLENELWGQFLDESRGIAKYLLSKYRVIER